MNHTILFIFALIAIVFAKPSTKGPESSSEEETKHKGLSKQHPSASTIESITSSGAEDVTDSSDVTTPAVDVVLQKKEVAIVLAEVPDAKERRSIKEGVTQQPEESTEIPESSSPVFVAVVAKEISAVTVDSVDGKDSSAVTKKDGVIVVV